VVSENDGHWKRMQFKGNKVWMAVDARQEPIKKSGKVLIKYQRNQDYEYWVHAPSVHSLNEAPPETARKKETAEPSTVPEKKLNCADAICIYTDGACSGNPGPAGIGVVMNYKGHTKEISRYIGIATNNRAELEAIRTGLATVKNPALPVVVFTDSSYALGILSRGWKAKQNLELVDDIRNLLARFKTIQFVKIKGHAGHPENERADRLAVQAINNTPSKR
jgi:ribonuclease HI